MLTRIPQAIVCSMPSPTKFTVVKTDIMRSEHES